MDFKNYCKVYFWDIVSKHYFDYKGRVGRKVFWLFNLNTFIISVILNIITGGIGSIFFAFAVLLPSLGLSIRRLHDINLRGWWFLINAIPVVGLAIFIVFVCLKGTKGANRFGSEPGAENIEAEVVA